ERELGGRVQVAAVNGPRAVVVSGEGEALDVVVQAFEGQGRRVRRLRVSHAFHSHLMEPMLAEFGEIAAQLTYHAPRLPVISNVSGQLATAAELTDPGYWVRQVRGTVRFHQGITTLTAAGVRTFAEIGPRGVLTAMVTDCLPPDIADSTVCVALSRTGRPETTTLVQALARLWTTGTHLDWHTLTPTNQNTTGDNLELPVYAFDRHRYWLDRTSQTGNGDLSRVGLTTLDHGLLAASVDVAGDGPLVLSGRISLSTHPWLADHAVAGTVLVPGSAFADLALRAGDETGCPQVEELLVQQPLVLPADSTIELQAVIESPGEDGRRTLSIHARTGDIWTRHAQATLTPASGSASGSGSDADNSAWPPAGSVAVPVETLYADLAERGYHYGPAFQGLTDVWRCADPAVLFAQVTLPEHTHQDAARYNIHPALLDAALHALQLHPAFPQDGTWLPFAWNHVTLHATNATTLHVTLHITPDNTIQLTATDPTNTLVIEAESVRLEEVEPARLSSVTSDLDGLYALEWVPVTENTATPLTSVAVLGEAPFTLPQATTHADTAALLASLDAGGALPQCAVLQIAAPEAVDVPAAAHELAEKLLLTVQAWVADERLESVPLVVVTRGAVGTGQGPDDPGVTDLSASVAWGLIRTAQTEHPDRFILLDAETTTADTEWDGLLAHAATGDEPQLAHHKHTLLAPRLQRAVTRQQGQDTDAVALDPAGTVLVTGGTEGLGRDVARHLVARHGVRHLVLTAHDTTVSDEATAELRAELAALGAQVTIAACDPADRAALTEVLADIPAEQPLTAVVHAVGEVAGGLLNALTPDRLGELLDAHVTGATALHELTRDLDLSAFVVFSSAAGVLGGAGYAGLAAAGSFLDALALRRRAEGLPGLSVAWGALRAQNGAGAAGSDAARLSREGAVALPVEECLALFDASLLSGTPLTVATRVDVQVLRERAMAGVLSPVWSGLVRTPLRRAAASEGGSGLALARRLLGLSKAERNRVVLDLVRGHVATILGHDSLNSVDETKGFLDSGVDSLTAVELRNRLSAATGLQLPATLVFDHPTPAALAHHVVEEVLGTSAALQPAEPVTAVDTTEPIAVVGIACRFPGGVRTPEDLWDLVAAGVDATGDFPSDRGWSEDLYDPDPEHPGTSYVRRGGFLDDVAGFDAEFFGISPREAVAMDPQQRLLLETSWEALERAGLDPQALKGSRTGVYVGAGTSSYICDMEGLPESVEGYAFTGNTSSVLSGRVSYSFGFEGPAVSVDTACSSSLVALHMAVQALRQGECTLALAGGVTVLASPGGFIEFSRQQALAPDGRCKPFSADADGTAWAEGVGLLALERLSDARRLGHKVLGVVRGSAVNQ
ncbi:SDR family NAD(P)-dependent oxidoreductase, partial [Streptomyces sp. NPDC047525]|uniref:SDR family NAD(P)-dependent oxidoreductase n=1 Tax=Streptomyces sp. NPDC047525 TaxID=3155264 RepID=UPI0034031541